MDPPQKRSKISEIDEESSISFLLKYQKVLECRICFEFLSSPLYPCKNGHTVCSSSSTKLGQKCPTCPCRIGSMRNRDLESVMESLMLSCPNKKIGCKETLDCNKWKKHQQTCIYTGCACPHLKCSFVSSSKELFQHFSCDHKYSATIFTYANHFSVSYNAYDEQIVLQEKNDGDLFLLDNSVARQDKNGRDLCLQDNSGVDMNVGYLVRITRIAPRSCKIACDYTLHCYSDKTLKNYVVLHSSTENCEGHYSYRNISKECLLVPSGFLGPTRLIELTVRIGKKKPLPDSTTG